LPKGPLYIVDGKKMDSSWSFEKSGISNKNIISVSVLKDEAAIKKYGSRGKNGVILIETHPKDARSLRKPVDAIGPGEPLRDTLKTKTPTISLKPSTRIELNQKVNAEPAIQLKPVQQIQLNLDRSTDLEKKPVIDIKIKDITIEAEKITYYHRSKKLTFTGKFGTKEGQGQASLSMDLNEKNNPMLVILDGRKLSLDKDVELQNRSFRLNEMKPEEAIRKYGEAGNNGALEITSL
jgi:bla regulator protein BlaR1